MARRRLLCRWCRGRHPTDKCPNREGLMRGKQYGSSEQGEYQPPAGLRVRVLTLPAGVDGQTMRRMLQTGAARWRVKRGR